MDLNKLRTQVFEKTGIKLDTSDPVFALVALNDAVLAESVEQQVAKLHEATEKMQEQTTHLIEAGDRVKNLLLQLGQTVEDPIHLKSDKPEGAKPNSPLQWQMIAAAGIVSLSSCLLMLIAQAAIGLPHIPAPVIVAAPQPQSPLTPEQITLMQNGEKYAKVWPKLDTRTQEKIKALMQ
jgi:hypothetical protein